MSTRRPINTPDGFPDHYKFTKPGHSECSTCGREFQWPDTTTHDWHEIIYCSTGCYTRDLVKAPPQARKILKVVIPIDTLPDCRFPCSQCFEIFTPGPGSYWIQANGIQGGVVIPVCSPECKEGYEVREALAAKAESEANRKVAPRKVGIGGQIHGKQVSAMIIDDPSSVPSNDDMAQWAAKVLKT